MISPYIFAKLNIRCFIQRGEGGIIPSFPSMLLLLNFLSSWPNSQQVVSFPCFSLYCSRCASQNSNIKKNAHISHHQILKEEGLRVIKNQKLKYFRVINWGFFSFFLIFSLNYVPCLDFKGNFEIQGLLGSLLNQF